MMAKEKMLHEYYIGDESSFLLRRPGEPEGHTDWWLLRLSKVSARDAASDMGAQGATGGSRGGEGRTQATAGGYPTSTV